MRWRCCCRPRPDDLEETPQSKSFSHDRVYHDINIAAHTCPCSFCALPYTILYGHGSNVAWWWKGAKNGSNFNYIPHKGSAESGA